MEMFSAAIFIQIFIIIIYIFNLKSLQNRNDLIKDYLLKFYYSKKIKEITIIIIIIQMRIICICFLIIFACGTPLWSPEKAWQWYNAQPWRVGVNFIPSTAVNQLEMWQSDTFDSKTIEKELAWAQLTGFSLLRVFLHIRVYLDDPSGFKSRINTFLSIAANHGHKTLFVFFDDCWKGTYSSGKQPEPIHGIHNSQWVQCPGDIHYTDQQLKNYVQDILTLFARDQRIIMWDMYNQVGNSQHFNKSFPLLKKVFQWARQIDIIQPITSCHWSKLPQLNTINDFILTNSDINTFHAYCDVPCTKNAINHNLSIYIDNLYHSRPSVCTQYMAREMTSLFETHLPLFKEHKVWAISWGLVFGRTQTYYPWWSVKGEPTPLVWFHDVFHPNGHPFSKLQTDFINEITSN